MHGVILKGREAILCPLGLLLLLLTRLLLLLLRYWCCWLLSLLALLVKEPSDLVVGEPLILQGIDEALLLVLSTCWGMRAFI